MLKPLLGKLKNQRRNKKHVALFFAAFASLMQASCSTANRGLLLASAADNYGAPSIDEVNEKLRFFGIDVCKNWGYETNGEISWCYSNAVEIGYSLQALSYTHLLNKCDLDNIDYHLRGKYSNFLTRIYRAIENDPPASDYFVSYLFLAAPALACLDLKIDSRRLKGFDVKYWHYVTDDYSIYYPSAKPSEDQFERDPSDYFESLRYYIARIALSESKFPTPQRNRDFEPNENPLILGDGSLTNLYFEQKNAGETHFETQRISYVLCFLKIYNTSNFTPDAKAFFDKIKSQTEADLNLPSICK